MSRTEFAPPPKPIRTTVATVAVALGAAAAALGNVALSQATPGLDIMPIMIGAIICLGVATAVAVLHGGRWLMLLSFAPSVLVLVGTVQLPPERALSDRGNAVEVEIVDESSQGASHEYVLDDGSGELPEHLEYRGSGTPYEVGDRLTVLVDPDGQVPLEDAEQVDPDGKLRMIIMGVVGWVVVIALAGWRGHVRRHRKKLVRETQDRLI
ncbi:MAG TPA: hypothetical protein VIP77_05475 [Jiangellaceae bacterium]